MPYKDPEKRKTYAKKYYKKWWKENSEKRCLIKAKRQKAKRKWFRELKATLSCEQCGFDHPAALDFHHTNDNKEKAVSAMISNNGKDRVLEEIKKCKVLCRNCHAVFHKKYNPPKKDGVCDECGGELFIRPDDNKGTINKRIDLFDMQMKPIEIHYLKEGILRKVDGCGDIQDIFEEILKSLGYVKYKDYFPPGP